MPEILVKTETPQANGWTFEVHVLDGRRRHRYEVTLNWSDYDLWCHGRTGPEFVVQAAFRFLLAREPASAILPRFDCAVMRRYFPEVDQELPRLLRG